MNDFSKMVVQRQGKPRQRVLLLEHFAFKIFAFAVYVLSSFVRLGYVATFIFVLILLSVDFWLAKNVCGRLLAGLRWWNVVDETSGAVVWRFETWTAEERRVAHQAQVKLFWAGLLGQQVLWGVLTAAAVFGLRPAWLLLALIACALNGANVYGYVRCKVNQGKEEEFDSGGGVGGEILGRLRESFVAMFVGRGGKYTRAETSDTNRGDTAEHF